MIYFTAHTFNCVCHCIRAKFRVLGMYNFDSPMKFLNFSTCQKNKLPSKNIYKLSKTD